MNLTKLFQWHYLWQRYPDGGFSLPMLIILLIIFLASIALAVWAHKKINTNPGVFKNVFKRIRTWGWLTGIFGLLMIFFRVAGAMYLSARLFLLVWMLYCLIWLVLIIIDWRKTAPKKAEAEQKKVEFNKWLPKAKK